MLSFETWGRVAAPVFCLLAGVASAHGVRSDIRLSLEDSAMAGLHVELHQGDIAPQLVLENRSGKMLEILDPSGKPFLRIGPEQVHADVNSPQFRDSLNPGALPREASAQNASKANWKPLRKDPAYGWFDPRLNPDPVQIPGELLAVGEETPVQPWSIPARLDGQKFEFRGQFIYLPPPRGVVQAAMRSAVDIAPGVRVMLAPGKMPALFLDNRSAETVSVLDAQGRAFLRIGALGVEADTASAAWKTAAPIRTEGKAGWQRISKARSYTWLEARGAWTGPLPRDGRRQTLNEWQVPVKIGDRTVVIRGVNEWVPLPKPAVAPGREGVWR